MANGKDGQDKNDYLKVPYVRKPYKMEKKYRLECLNELAARHDESHHYEIRK